MAESLPALSFPEWTFPISYLSHLFAFQQEVYKNNLVANWVRFSFFLIHINKGTNMMDTLISLSEIKINTKLHLHILF